jgi:hypothetical protein
LVLQQMLEEAVGQYAFMFFQIKGNNL